MRILASSQIKGLVVAMVMAILGIVGAIALCAAPPQTGSDARARDLIRLLNLKVLPRESGYLGIIGVSAQKVAVHGRKLAVQSQNYYMLTRELPINYLHWLAPEDTHVLIEGGPVDYFVSVSYTHLTLPTIYSV